MSTHTHPHAHPHEQDASVEVQDLGPTDAGSVVMDIGGEWGSLMILAPVELLGAEIEISPVDMDHERTHIAIRERRVPAGIRWAGIFPRLLAGEYTIWSPDGTSRGSVSVVGGQITDYIWS